MFLTLLHSERPKLYTILAFLSAVELKDQNCKKVEFANSLDPNGMAPNNVYCLSSSF